MVQRLKNADGTSKSGWYIGNDANQAYIKNDSGTLKARNTDDSAYINLSVLTPTEPEHAVTKSYVDSMEGNLVISRQADCSAALPTNTGVAGYVVVTTAGTGAVVGDLLRDDGSGSGDMSIIAARNGRSIMITTALTGGTVEFEPDCVYTWDTDATPDRWLKVADIGSVSGAIRMVKMTIGTDATYTSTLLIPADNEVISVRVTIGTAYSAGATIKVGYAEDDDAIVKTTDINPQVENVWTLDQETAWHSADRAVIVTISDTPAAGAGVVRVFFSNPNA
jgi:hypothetical protein